MKGFYYETHALFTPYRHISHRVHEPCRLLRQLGRHERYDETSADTTTVPETEELTDGLPDKDMEGFSLNILHHDTSWLSWAKTQLVAEEENGELINDTIYERNAYIEDRFNCTLNVAETNKTEAVFKNLVMSGDQTHDLIMQYGLHVLGNIDYLADFNNLPYINLEADYWNPNATTVFAVGDKQLAVAGNYTLSYLSGATTFLFNKELTDNLKITDTLYDAVYDGTWTTDMYYETALKGISDLNGDSKIDESDRLGMSGQSKAYWNSLIIGAGFRYVEFDENHYPTFNMSSNEKMLEFFQMIVEKESADPGIYYVSGAVAANKYPYNGAPAVDFKAGGSLFYTTTIFDIEAKLRDMEADFGILPPPKYDAAQESYKAYANIGEIMTLPRTFDMERAENVGMLLEAMAFYSQQNLVPAYRETVMQVKLTRDEDSANMLDYIFSDIVFDYGTVVWESKITQPLVKNYLIPRSSTLVSTVDGLAATLEADIEKLIESAKNVP